jgi:hypothetical protein
MRDSHPASHNPKSTTRRMAGRIAVAMAIVGIATTMTAGQAFAGDVTWLNAATDLYLTGNGLIDAGSSDSLITANAYVGLSGQTWTDTRQSNGTWTEANDAIAGCLDSNAEWGTYGAAYLHTCNGGGYQDWYELDTSTGWALEDYQTGLFLDGGNGPSANGQFADVNVFTNSNFGNSDLYQRWH